MSRSKEELQAVISNFQIDGEIVDVGTWGSGHIHETYASKIRTKNGEIHYIHQWINHHVFKDPVKVMQNIERVTKFARDRINANGGDPLRETLTLVPTQEGQLYYQASNGEYWRTDRKSVV